jgi:hypothetical protein
MHYGIYSHETGRIRSRTVPESFWVETRAGKKNFLSGGTTWGQTFPADQLSIFVLNLCMFI